MSAGKGVSHSSIVCLQVRYVKGIDLSPREVEEAQRRYASEKALPRRRGAVCFPPNNGCHVRVVGLAGWSFLLPMSCAAKENDLFFFTRRMWLCVPGEG